MWLKKLFSHKEEAEKQPSEKEEPLEEEATQQESTIFTVPEQDIDLRYSKLPIISPKNINLPKNELHLLQFAFMHECLQAKNKFAEEWTQVQLIITDKQMVVTPDILQIGHDSIHDHNILHVPFGMVEKVDCSEHKKQEGKLVVAFKDGRQLWFTSKNQEKLRQAEKLIREFGFPRGINQFFAFKYGKVAKVYDGWMVYDFNREIQRQGVHKYLSAQGQNEEGRPYRLISNQTFELSPTYPSQFIVPAQMDDKDIARCASFRTKERLPILSYFYQYQPSSFASLFRCSQNKGGILTSRCVEDEKMVQCISVATSSISKAKIQSLNCQLNVKIFDARGYYAAWGNKLAGKGFESEENYNCQIKFLDIPNIHAVRDSYNKVRAYNPYQQDFLQVLGESGWIDYLYLILTGAKDMAQCMRSGTNVVVHCSDGWDRTTQLSSLTQIILDPYFRTIEGFMALFQKDWRHCGHKFRERSGQYNHKDYSPKQISPIFIQYLDCVLQLMGQFPLSFQFNIKLLNFVGEAYQSYVYGSFLTNNIKEGQAIGLEGKTVSVWSDVLEERDRYCNVFYRREGPEVLEVDVSGMDFTVWREHFLGEKSLALKQHQHCFVEKQINRQLQEQLLKCERELEQLEQRVVQQQVKVVEKGVQ